MAPTEQQLRQKKVLQLSGKNTKKKKSGVTKARIQRYITKTTTSQIKELGAKHVLLLKGRSTSESMNKLLQELRTIQAPASKLLNKKNPIDVFSASGSTGTTIGAGGGDGGIQSLEFLLTKNDCNLFGMATHNKKRPNNLIIGRSFNSQILDIVELGIVYYKSSLAVNTATGDNDKVDIPKKRIGSKPLLLFMGDIWDNIQQYSLLRNLLIDFYRGDVVDKLVVSGLDHVIVFTAAFNNNLPTTTTAPSGTTLSSNHNPSNVIIHQRTYHVQLKKNPNGSDTTGTAIPIAQLTPSGPDLDMMIRRSIWATPEMAIAARVLPKSSSNKNGTTTTAKSRKKNQSTNVFGETIGRLHLERQVVDKKSGRKVKALRRAEQNERREEKLAIESELQNESNELEQEFQNTFGFKESK